MVKYILILVCGALLLYSCGNGSVSEKTATSSNKEKIIYTCEMHPEVISDKPGKCPKCGMELVKKNVPVEDSINVEQEDTMDLTE